MPDKEFEDDPPNGHSTPLPEPLHPPTSSTTELFPESSKGSKYNDNSYYTKPSKKRSKFNPKPKPQPEKIENLGDFPVFGFYTLFFLFLHEAVTLPQMANMTFMVYGGFTPTVDSCGDNDFSGMSRTEACLRLDEVQLEANCTPHLTSQFHSVAYEFGYYCDRIQKVKNSISIQMFGVLFGALFFGQLSDLFGRRRIMLICALGMGVFDYLSSTSTNLMYFSFLQFGALFFTGGTSTISHVFLMETIPKKHRVWITMAISYSPNYIILAGIAYLSQDWRTMLRVMSFLNVPTFICLFLAYESPRFLIQKGALEQAKTTYEKIEKLNGSVSIDRQRILDELIQKEVVMLEQKKKARKYYFHHLFYTWKMMRYSVILSFSLFCTAMITYSLIFNMEKLSGSVYLNNILLGVIRYSFNMGFALLDYKCPKMGRKNIHRWVILYIILALGAVYAIKTFDLDYATTSNLSVLSATAMCSQLFMVALIVTSELFPTPVRNIAASFQQIWTRIGVVVAPHFFYIFALTPTAPYLFMICFLFANLVLFFLLIPETKGHAMTDHMPPKSERIFLKKSKENQVLTETSPNIELTDQL